jgi:ribonuclease G
MKQLIIANMVYQGISCLAAILMQDGKAVNIYLDKPGEESLLGSIHVGKVQKILPNIGGAFVEIENRRACYYPYKKSSGCIYTNRMGADAPGRDLKVGDELLVQVTQEALKTKAPSVSSNLSLAGNYLVLTTENKKIGVSSKISKNRRDDLKEIFEGLLGEERDFGVVIRTNAAGVELSVLEEELNRLSDELGQIKRRADFSPCFTKLKEGASGIEKLLKKMYWGDLEKVICDEHRVYQEVQGYISKLDPIPDCEIKLYQDKLLPLYKLYRFEHELAEAVKEKVWLKSGGFLVIEQTEAFVSIDVNSGKNVSRKQNEEVYQQINLEAAKEIARQMRVRNLYGMILIDFINMHQPRSQAQLLNSMREFVKDDRIKTVAVDVTALGIMEITRKKEEKSLSEQIMELSAQL